MGRYFGFVRLAIVWLVVFMVARFIRGASGTPYEEGTWPFSMVMLASLAALFFAAFSRRMLGTRWYQGMLVGATIGFSAQVLIFLATVGSYVVGAETYFNAPTALNVEEPIGLAQALGIRAFGLVVNTIICSIVGLIGWSMGKLIPERTASA